MASALGIDDNPWKASEETVTFDCAYFQVRQDRVSLAGRQERPYSSIRMKYFGVCALPVDGDGRVALVGQYRYVLDRYTWEGPGGGAVMGSDPLVTAKAELEEEIGYRASRWLKLVEGAVSPGISNEIVPAYVAWELERTRPADNADELLSRRWVRFAEALEMALSGAIGNLVATSALLALDVKLRRGDLPENLATALQS